MLGIGAAEQSDRYIAVLCGHPQTCRELELNQIQPQRHVYNYSDVNFEERSWKPRERKALPTASCLGGGPGKVPCG